jgi:hypothetical protein
MMHNTSPAATDRLTASSAQAAEVARDLLDPQRRRRLGAAVHARPTRLTSQPACGARPPGPCARGRPPVQPNNVHGDVVIGLADVIVLWGCRSTAPEPLTSDSR